MSGQDRDPFPLGAAEAARLAREVQDLGFEAARTIVERFVEIFDQFATTNGRGGTERRNGVPGGGGGGGGSGGIGGGGGSGGRAYGSWGSERSMRAAQSDMQRAAAAYVGMLGQLNEAALGFLDASRWFDPTRWCEPPAAEQGDLLRLPDVAPGGRASAHLWLHNTTASAAVDLRAWCPGLASHRGVALPATAVTCAPEKIDRLEADASRQILVTVAVGEDAPAGTYHGQLLVDGLPDVVFPLRARVVPAATKPS